MGARGRIRRRSNGEPASGRRVRSAPSLMVDFPENPVAAVSPEALAEAVTIRNGQVPIRLADVQAIEASEGVDGIDRRESMVEEETVARLGVDVGEAASWRAALLCRLLTREDPLHHEILENGDVEVDRDLLSLAASSAISDHPAEELSWPSRADRGL